MFECKVLTHFAAAHQLQMVGEKCENLHGHNWHVEVKVRGLKLDDAGVLVDFGILKQQVRAIMKTLDHKFLNDLECFDGRLHQPSSEHIALYIARTLSQEMDVPGVWVHSVAAWESDNACATYYLKPPSHPTA
jgi:6-pyruvoyltetrahydropterin/6-carboxytetrahydropterin synthase